MISLIQALPMPVRLALLALMGAWLGSFVNWSIYRLAFRQRAISPWGPAPAIDAATSKKSKKNEIAPRSWRDRIPLLGWILLARETPLHGTLFWIRPLLLELSLAIALPLLYHFEIAGSWLPPIGAIGAPSAAQLHATYLAHIVLLLLLTVATFIDFDEKTIPDEITVPGTLLALLLALLLPQSHLPALILSPQGLPIWGNLTFTSTIEWPSWVDGAAGLAIASAVIVGWSIALVPTIWRFSGGLARGCRLYLASLARYSRAMIIAGAMAEVIVVIAWLMGDAAWRAMLTSVVGLAFGGGLIWSVRIVGQIALRKEAMGFGDVTLMAMIGAFLGWQVALLVFFFSPVTAVIVSLTQWIFTGRREIAFGPYLALAAVWVVVRWGLMWEDWARGIFELGWLIPIIVGVCLLLMLGLLMTWRIIEQLLFGRGS